MFGLREKWRAIGQGAPIDGDDWIGLQMIDMRNRLEGSGKIVVIGLLSAGVLAGGYIGYQSMIPHTQPPAVVSTAPKVTPNGAGSHPNGSGSGSSPKVSTAPHHKSSPKHQATPKHKTTPKTTAPKVQTVGKPVHGVPNFWVAPTGNIFRDITAINTRYIVWGNHQIARDVPGIAATGPHAGTLTPQVMNSPAILKKYPGPKVPTSLKAAGVKLPAGTPKNGAVTGLSLPAMQAALKANPWLKNVTPQQLMGAYQVAAEYTMVSMSNNEMAALHYVDSYSGGNYAKVWTEAEAGVFASQAGQLSSKQISYQSSVAYDLQPGNYFGAYQLGRDTLTRAQRSNTVAAHLVILNTRDDIIGSSLVHGHIVIGRFPVTVGYTFMVLIRNGSQEHWYITGTSNIVGSNTPNQTYWTGPQGG